MGAFVPAQIAEIGVIDRLFARVGASDNVAKHMSTFHMEMTETANILTYATSQSFVILDEIGMSVFLLPLSIYDYNWGGEYLNFKLRRCFFIIRKRYRDS